jgi:cation transport ATPase
LKNDFEINEFIEEWYKIASKQAPIPTPNEAFKPRLNQKRAIDSEYAKTSTPNSLEPIQEPKQPNFQYFSKEAMVTIIIAFTSFFLITKAESIQFFINTNTNWPLITFILTLLVAIGAGTYLYHTGELEVLRRRLQPYFSIEAIITIIITFSFYLLITKAESIQFFINTNTNWSLIALILILLMGIGSGAYLYQTGELELLRRRLQR